mmetsp:Transcript_44887/g.108936  ORF Transcript_44887/g.108936 Transcript_44887/m.108936 type:complete len:584 (+) Transcript_44887:130-1881(+)
MDGNNSNTNDSSAALVVDVRPNDVLFGRGSGPNDHEGNIRFRELIAQRKEQYMNTNHRQTKAKIAKDIVDQVFGVDGRFLKKLEGKELTKLGYGQGQDVYQVASDDMIMEKAKQALRQNRNRDNAAGGGGEGNSPKPSSVAEAHVTMASVSPIFQQTLQQYGNDAVAAGFAPTAAAAVAATAPAAFGNQQEQFLYQQQQQNLINNGNNNMMNPMVNNPSTSNNMYQQQQQSRWLQQQQHHPQKPIYSLNTEGYATYTETLVDPEDRGYLNSGGGGGDNSVDIPLSSSSGGGGDRTRATNMMMMQSTGNSRRGSALLGGRRSDAMAGNRRESLRMDEIWRRDSMAAGGGGGIQAQSMQMSELMESFRGMSATGAEMSASMDTIGTIDNFGSLGGIGESNAYNMSGMSNMSTMSMGSIFKTTPDTPSSDGKSGTSSHGSSSMDRQSSSTHSSDQQKASSTVPPERKVVRTSSGDASLGGSDLWNSKQISSLMETPFEDSITNAGGAAGATAAGTTPRGSRQVDNLMHAPIESSSDFDISHGFLTSSTTTGLSSGSPSASEGKHQQQASYPGQILPSGSNHKKDSI